MPTCAATLGACLWSAMPETTAVLQHLTLTSGDLRPSPRSEVADDIVAMLRPIVRAGGGVLRDLRITLSAPPPWLGGVEYDLGWSEDPTAPDVRGVLCWSPAEHAAWWGAARALTAWLRLAAPAEPPTTPWLAVAIQPTALSRTPDQLAMLGDAERCVAWAILEETIR